MTSSTASRVLATAVACLLCFPSAFAAEKPAKKAEPAVSYPPRLPDGQESVTDTSPRFLEPPGPVLEGVALAKTAPTVDFVYFPGQDYPGNPWSAWGDSLAANGKYYAAIGDHLAPGVQHPTAGKTIGELWEEFDHAGHEMVPVSITLP